MKNLIVETKSGEHFKVLSEIFVLDSVPNVLAKKLKNNSVTTIDVTRIEKIIDNNSINEDSVNEIVISLIRHLDTEVNLGTLQNILLLNGLSGESIKKIKDFCIKNEFDFR